MTLTAANKCRLCNSHDLINAHIIPKQFFEIDGKIYSSKLPYTQRIKQGSYDSNILCGKCDGGLLSSLDTAGYDFFLGPIENKHKKRIYGSFQNDFMDIYEVEIQNQLIHKFLYSILWRASITTRGEFRKVDIGSKHEENLKSLFCSSQLIDIYKYPIVLCYLENLPIDKFPLMPFKTRGFANINYYKMYLGRYIINIKVDKRNDDRMFPKELTMGHNGKVVILSYDYNGSNEQKSVLKILRK